MKRERIWSFLLCVILMCAAAVSVNHGLFGRSFEPSKQSDNSIETDTLSVLADGTKVIHTALLTDVDGYAGPVPLDVYIKDDRISDIKALPNAETPGFFKRSSVILDEWIGKTVQEASEMKVDGVSGATYSSNAIRTNVDAAISYYLKTKESDRKEVPLKIWIALAVTLAACIVPLFLNNKVYLRIQMIANIIVLGFWCGQFLDYAVMLRYLSNGISLPEGLIAVLMLVAAFIYPLFGKPQHYCNHICPLGSAQILVAQICHYKLKISTKVLKGLDWFRRLLWAALMLLLWGDIFTDWMNWELFQAFMVESAPVAIIVIAAVFILLSAVVSRPYCRFVCPTGSLFKRSENIG